MSNRARGRRLETVLFTDIVGSTDVATKLGDARWRELLGRHHTIIRRELKRFRGREIDTAGDGFFATFDAPADGVRCACAASDAVRELGIEIRAGLHFGETEEMRPKVAGIAVVTASRIAALAGPSEVFVSSTIEELVAGSGLGLEDRGSQELKGLPGEKHVFAVTSVDGSFRDAPLDPAAAEERLALVEPPRSVRRRGPWLAGVLLALLLLVGWFLFGRGEPVKTPSRASTEPPLGSIVEIEPTSGKLMATIPNLLPLHGDVIRIATGENGVWLLDAGDVVHVDPQTLKARPPIAVGTNGTETKSLVIGYRLVWIGVAEGLARVDPANDQVLAPVHLRGFTNANGLRFQVNSVAVGAGSIWATSDQSGLVGRVDPKTGAASTIHISGATDGVAVGDGSVWVIDNLGGTLSRIDPTSGKMTGQVSLTGNLARVVAGEGAIWVLDTGAGTVIPVDPITLRPLSPIRVGNGPSDIALGLGAVWVTNLDDGTISKIDVATKVVTEMKIGSPVAAIAVDEVSETLWVAIAPKPNQ